MTVRGIKCLGRPMGARAGPWLPHRPLADVPVALPRASGPWQELGLYFGAELDDGRGPGFRTTRSGSDFSSCPRRGHGRDGAVPGAAPASLMPPHRRRAGEALRHRDTDYALLIPIQL